MADYDKVTCFDAFPFPEPWILATASTEQKDGVQLFNSVTVVDVAVDFDKVTCIDALEC